MGSVHLTCDDEVHDYVAQEGVVNQLRALPASDRSTKRKNKSRWLRMFGGDSHTQAKKGVQQGAQGISAPKTAAGSE